MRGEAQRKTDMSFLPETRFHNRDLEYVADGGWWKSVMVKA
jgi:hypothetical protein